MTLWLHVRSFFPRPPPSKLREFLGCWHYDLNRKRKFFFWGYDEQCVIKMHGKCMLHIFLSGLLLFKEGWKEHFLFVTHVNLTALEREERGMRFPCSPSKAPEPSLEHCVMLSACPPGLLPPVWPSHHVCTWGTSIGRDILGAVAKSCWHRSVWPEQGGCGSAALQLLKCLCLVLCWAGAACACPASLAKSLSCKEKNGNHHDLSYTCQCGLLWIHET